MGKTFWVCAALMACALIASAAPDPVSAREHEVTVSLPQFPVTLNGIEVDSATRTYPLLVYQDITYFPMTYYDSRFLGVETNWSREEGLAIEETGVSAIYRDDRRSAKNSRTFQAAIRTGEIRLNGKVIDTDGEPYPFLVYRDVTYFPLTWKYAVEELGWQYAFDSRNGLVIQSSNPQPVKINLDGFPAADGVIAGGYYYYVDGEGAVIRSPLNEPEQKDVAYRLPIWSYGDGSTYVSANLYIRDGDVMLYYHQGGAVMGSDHYLKLTPSGEFEEVESGYLFFRHFADTTVKVDLGFPPSSNNLYVKKGNEPYQPAGDPMYMYGWRLANQDGAAELGSIHSYTADLVDLELVNGKIYVLAHHTESDTDYSRLHSVDLSDQTTERVSDLQTSNFAVNGGFIYFVHDDKLYRKPLAGGAEEPVFAQDKVSWLRGENGYLLCAFVKESDTPYGMVVFDPGGEVVFKTSDVVGNVSIQDGRLIYTEITTEGRYAVDLPPQ